MLRNSIQDYVNTDDLKNKKETLENAVRRTREYLLDIQNEDGCWVGELEADSSVPAGYIPLMYFMEGSVDPVKQAKIVKTVLGDQNEDGSWSTFKGGPGDVNVTVQVYFALKLAGIPAREPCMRKACSFVLSRGGLMKTNTITRIFLALFGQFDYRGTPSIPPEIIFIPDWFYLNIYEFASWSRETIMALILVLNYRPVCPVPSSAGIQELFLEPAAKRRFRPAQPEGIFGWKNFFLAADFILKLREKLPMLGLRKLALRKVEKWVVDHQEEDGSWGGIMLPWIYSLMVLKSIGYENNHPVISAGLKGLDAFIREGPESFKLEPAVSPVWDTAWAVLSLVESGLPPGDPSLLRACRWLLKKQINFRGDWKIKNPRCASGCWSFEYEIRFYPDIDDTAVVARALSCIRMPLEEESQKTRALRRGLFWVCDMQSSDGGWAAFDRDNNKQVLANVPYADFITPLDPTSPDVTAHAVELLGALNRNSPPLARAVNYLKKTQQPDGAWFGRWGVNYIYGTGLVLVSLTAADQSMDQDYILRATSWLIAHQNPDGGWGESCATYDNPALRGQGPGTASQTAWALLGLIAAGKGSSGAVQKGIDYLIKNQNSDGSWTEDYHTGTGFPGAFYLRYDLYRIYFPLLALGHYRAFLEDSNVSIT